MVLACFVIKDSSQVGFEDRERHFWDIVHHSVERRDVSTTKAELDLIAALIKNPRLF